MMVYFTHQTCFKCKRSEHYITTISTLKDNYRKSMVESLYANIIPGSCWGKRTILYQCSIWNRVCLVSTLTRYDWYDTKTTITFVHSNKSRRNIPYTYIHPWYKYITFEAKVLSSFSSYKVYICIDESVKASAHANNYTVSQKNTPLWWVWYGCLLRNKCAFWRVIAIIHWRKC